MALLMRLIRSSEEGPKDLITAVSDYDLGQDERTFNIMSQHTEFPEFQ